MKIKIDYELVILVAFLIFINFIGYANLMDNKMIHEYPFGYKSNDMFERAFLAESIKDVGNFKYLAPYLSQGLSNTVSHYYPLFEHLPASLSILSGFEVYDSLYFIVFLMVNLSIFMMYFLIKNFNSNIALLSLPFMSLIYFKKFFVGNIIGIWGYSTSVIFLISIFFLLMFYEKDKIYLLIAALFVILIHTRISEAIIAFAFLFIYLILKFLSKKWDKELTKKSIILFLSILVLSSYYLIYFKNLSNTLATNTPLITFNREQQEFYGIELSDFGIPLLIVLLLGILISFIYTAQYMYPLLIGMLLIAFHYSNYLGGKISVFFGSRTFMLPIFVAFFFGLCVYILISVTKNIIKIDTKIKSVLVFILLMCLIFFTQYTPVEGTEGFFNKEKWDAFKWIENKSPLTANVFFMYGDGYTQTNMMLFLKRNQFFVDLDEVKKQISTGELERIQKIQPIHSVLFYKKGLLEVGNLMVSQKGYDERDQDINHLKSKVLNLTQDICSFDYYIIDKYSMQQIIISNFNNKFKEQVLKKEWFAVVYDNNFVTILKNNKVGADCIG